MAVLTEVDDGKPTVGQTNQPVVRRKASARSGPPMDQGISHADGDHVEPGAQRISTEPSQTDYSTHLVDFNPSFKNFPYYATDDVDPLATIEGALQVETSLLSSGR